MPERRPPSPGPGASRLPTRFARNAVSNYALTAVLVGVALVTTPILTHHLGTQRFGIWVFVGSTITYVQLLDLGFGGAVVAAVARLIARGDEAALERALNTSFFILLGLGVVGMGVCGLAAAFLPGALHLEGSLAATTRDLFLLLGFDVAVSIPMDTFGCGLVALQRYDLLNATLIGVAVGQAVGWTVVLLSGGGLLLLGIASVSISLVGQGVRYVLLRRLLPGISISPSRFERSLVRSLASPAGWYALGNLIDNFRDQASVLILGLVQNVSGAGIFAVGDKLATLGTQMGTPVVLPFFPHAATLVGRGDEAELAETARTGTRVTAGVTIPFCLVVALLARPALIAWVGTAYERATPAVVILAAAFGLRSLCSAPILLLSGAGGQRLVAVLGVVKASLQIVLSAVLGAMFGITGVAVAILVAVVAVDTGLNLPLVTRRLGTRFTLTVLPVLRAHVIPFVVAGVGGWFLAQDEVLGFVRSHNRPAGLAVVVAAGLGILLVYVVLLVLTGVDRATRRRTVVGLRHPWRTGREALLSTGSTPPAAVQDAGGKTNGSVPTSSPSPGRAPTGPGGRPTVGTGGDQDR